MMEVDKKYKNLNTDSIVKCVYISDNGGAAAIEYSDGTIGATHKNSKWWREVPKEKWIVLMWKNGFKNDVICNSEIFSSYQEAYIKWGSHGYICKIVQIE